MEHEKRRFSFRINGFRMGGIEMYSSKCIQDGNTYLVDGPNFDNLCSMTRGKILLSRQKAVFKFWLLKKGW